MSEQTSPQKEPLSLIRKIIAAIGILVMVVSGGCTLAIGVPFLFQGQAAGVLFAALLFGGIPFAVGFLIFWLATTLGRKE